MSKHLYISDLDGTLLNKNVELSPKTIAVLNDAISKGVNFTVATARTSATVVQILSEVNINLPVVLMNGVCIYDIAKKQYIQTHPICTKSICNIIKIFNDYTMDGFMYAISDNLLYTFYERVDSPNAEEFIKERQRRYGKAFTRVDSFWDCVDKGIVYYSVSNKKELLDPIYSELVSDKNINVEYYRDIYEPDFWYLEICSANASKYNAVEFLRKNYGFDVVTGFGDNLNDIPMFKACDESFAVENAKPEVKHEANGVIGANFEDAVALWLETNAVGS